MPLAEPKSPPAMKTATPRLPEGWEAANTAADWIATREWDAWGMPQAAVHGEYYHADAFEAILGEATPGGYSLPAVATLEREPDNAHDSNAIKVIVQGKHVGYFARALALQVAPMMDRVRCRQFQVAGIIRGGDSSDVDLAYYVDIWPGHILSAAPQGIFDPVFPKAILTTDSAASASVPANLEERPGSPAADHEQAAIEPPVEPMMPPVSPERLEKVREAVRKWTRSVTDSSRRNYLLFYRNLLKGTLSFDDCDPDQVLKLVLGKTVSVTSLWPATGKGRFNPFWDEANQRLNVIRRQSNKNMDDRGVETAYLGVGMATWEIDEGSAPNAPVFLVPITIQGTRGTYTITASDVIDPNPVLAYKLDKDYDFPLLQEVLDDDPKTPGRPLIPEQLQDWDEVEKAFDELEQKAPPQMKGFRISRKLVAGNFHFERMAMVREMETRMEAMAANDLVAALAGWEPARERLASVGEVVGEQDLDRRADTPDYIIDADASQRLVIEAVRRGRTGVISGPPGTGKSQTIANLIAALIGQGKSVLFIAEKKVALTVVEKRLQEAGLGDALLSLHSDIDKRQTYRELARPLLGTDNDPAPAAPKSQEGIYKSLRDAVTAHAESMNKTLEPWGLSAFDLQARNLALKAQGQAEAPPLWTNDSILALSTPVLDELRAALSSMSQVAAELIRPVSVWNESPLRSAFEIKKSVTETDLLLQSTFPKLEQTLTWLTEANDVPFPETLAQIAALSHLASKTADLESGHQPALVPKDPAAIARLLEDTLLKLDKSLTWAEEATGIAAPTTIAEAERASALVMQTARFEVDYRPALLEADVASLQQSLAAAPSLPNFLLLPFYRSYRAAWRELKDCQRTPGERTRRRREADLAEAMEIKRQWQEMSGRPGEIDQSAAALLGRAVQDAKNGVVNAYGDLGLAFSADGDLAATRKLLRQALTQHEVAQAWRQAGGRPASIEPAKAAAFSALAQETAARLASIFAALGQSFDPGVDLGGVQKLLQEALAQEQRAYLVPQVREAEQRFAALHAEPLLEYFREHRVPFSDWFDVLEASWLKSCLEYARLADPQLAQFAGQAHDGIVQNFQERDLQRISDAASRVKGIWRAGRLGISDRDPGFRLIVHEASKKQRFISLRKLMATAAATVLTLRPCWMMSPLSVSRLLGGSDVVFDVVIMDEASQVLPATAMPAFSRAKVAVIAGDNKQLPPTSFFATVEDETDEETEGEDAEPIFESILDNMQSLFTPWHLRWHYRSRDERLIAFSNEYFYGNSLVTFPGSNDSEVLRHVVVEPIPEPTTFSSSAEIKEILEEVKRHCRVRPSESLGIIAFGLEHAERIEMAVDELEKTDDQVRTFMRAQVGEPFFVKNLERVQGDERDAIILSVGYCPPPGRKSPRSFGPLSVAGGERRLNVAITRAKQRMTLISSFDHIDLESSGATSEGVRLLKLYMDYASSGGRRLAGEGATEVPLNGFELDVLDEMHKKGWSVIPQYGISGYRLDFAIQHPQRSNRFLLAVEADGASYHSAPTARDRDRLRQQHLQSLGWQFFRIWSTDWFNNKAAVMERLEKSYESALAAA
jgi:very-short-patch-repair endonuclease